MWNLIAAGLLLVGVSAVFYGVIEHIKEKGRAELRPKLEVAEAKVAKLEIEKLELAEERDAAIGKANENAARFEEALELFKKASAELEAMKTAAERKEAELKRTLLALAKEREGSAVYRARLAEIALRPERMTEGVLEETDRILRELARRRLPNREAGRTDSGGAEGRGGAGAGPGVVHHGVLDPGYADAHARAARWLEQVGY